MVTETKNSSLVAAPSKTPAGWVRVSRRWGFAAIAIAAVALAAWPTVVVARGTQLTTAHRAAAAWTALLVVAALAVVAQVVLTWYQARLSAASGQPALADRRQGLKAAVIGKDGPAD